MTAESRGRILVVDDEATIRDSTSLLLRAAGYEVRTAEHGLDGLSQLANAPADVVISDLNMPQMSGFEFMSVLRRRFPEVLVIAISGAYDSGDQVPGGVIADAFHAKGHHHPNDLLCTIAELINTRNERAISHNRESAPVWIRRNGRDSDGIAFIVLTCTQCLRSFPLSVIQENVQEIQETSCLFCSSPVRYVIDFSIDVISRDKVGVARVD